MLICGKYEHAQQGFKQVQENQEQAALEMAQEEDAQEEEKEALSEEQAEHVNNFDCCIIVRTYQKQFILQKLIYVHGFQENNSGYSSSAGTGFSQRLPAELQGAESPAMRESVAGAEQGFLLSQCGICKGR